MRDEMAEALESSADVRRHADGELTHRLVMFDGEDPEEEEFEDFGNLLANFFIIRRVCCFYNIWLVMV